MSQQKSGAAIGTMSHALTWEEVKTTYDAAGLRFEGTSWLASFGCLESSGTS